MSTFIRSFILFVMEQELEGKSFGNKGIKVADVKPRSFEKKNKPTMAIPPNAEKTDKIAISGDVVDVSVSSNGTLDVDGGEENSTLNGSASSGKSARDVVTPLAHMPYSEQLEHKKSSLMQILKRLVSISSYYLAYLPCHFFFCIFWSPFYLHFYPTIVSEPLQFFIFRLEMHVKLVLMVFHYQNGFSSLGK